MLLAPTCFNLKCCEVAKNIRIIHVKVGLCVCVCAFCCTTTCYKYRKV